LEIVEQDARQVPTIRYAVFEKDSDVILYLAQQDLDGDCNLAGIDLTQGG
jgi:hypothetical protein